MRDETYPVQFPLDINVIFSEETARWQPLLDRLEPNDGPGEPMHVSELAIKHIGATVTVHDGHTVVTGTLLEVHAEAETAELTTAAGPREPLVTSIQVQLRVGRFTFTTSRHNQVDVHP